MTSDIAFLISLICSGFIIILTAIDYVINKRAYARIKIRGTGIVIIIFIGLMIFFSCWQRIIEKKTSHIADSTNSSYQKKIDSFRNEANISLVKQQDSITSYSKKHSKEIEETTFTLTKTFISGTKSIIESAQSDAEKLRDSLRVLKERQLPNISYPIDGQIIDCYKGHDTLFISPLFRNSGESVAVKVNFNLYYLIVINDKPIEYYKPVMNSNGLNIPKGETYSAVIGKSYITPFIFDSTNNLQFILILGDYTNDDNKNKVVKPLELCYMWDRKIKKWAIYGYLSKVKNAHFSKDLPYFSSYP